LSGTPLANKSEAQLCPYDIITLKPEPAKIQGFAVTALFFHSFPKQNQRGFLCDITPCFINAKKSAIYEQTKGRKPYGQNNRDHEQKRWVRQKLHHRKSRRRADEARQKSPDD